jgi:hypothetical protein
MCSLPFFIFFRGEYDFGNVCINNLHFSKVQVSNYIIVLQPFLHFQNFDKVLNQNDSSALSTILEHENCGTKGNQGLRKTCCTYA